MRGNYRWLCFCLLLGTLMIGSKADYLKVRTWFPDNPEMEVIPGKLTTAIIGVRNVGDGPINITAAMGGLALVSNPEGSVYNFSAVGYNILEMASGEEKVVQYGMYMPKNLPTRDFILRVQLFWSYDDVMYSSLAYHDTISVIEPSKLIDTELLGLYLVLLSGLAAAVYFGLNTAKRRGWLKKTKKSKVAAGTPNDDNSEWLKGTVADKSKKASKQS